jgi:hypothetical protein
MRLVISSNLYRKRSGADPSHLAKEVWKSSPWYRSSVFGMARGASEECSWKKSIGYTLKPNAIISAKPDWLLICADKRRSRM